MRGSLNFPPHDPPVSGTQRLVGYSVDLTDPGGTARVSLDIRAQHMNRNGSLHGGLHATIMDAAAGFAASRHLAGGAAQIVPVVTLSLTTNFLAPAVSGRVVAVGHVTGGGRKIVYANAEVLAEDGTVLSTCTGVFRRAPGE